MGLSGNYRRFIENYGALAKPVTVLLKKDVVWEWISPSNEAFQQLKQAICYYLALAFINFQFEFCINTDACGHGIEVILQHKGVTYCFF